MSEHQGLPDYSHDEMVARIASLERDLAEANDRLAESRQMREQAERELEAVKAERDDAVGKARAHDDTHSGAFIDRAHAIGQREIAAGRVSVIGRNVWHTAVEVAERAEKAEAERDEAREETARLQRSVDFNAKAYLAEHEHWGECKFKAQVAALREALRCEGTKSGRHEWRGSEYDTVRPQWCCRCARDARDIVDSALAAREDK